MKIKKIVFKFKSGYITPLKSDTILSYIFAYNFEKLKDIYMKILKKRIFLFLLQMLLINDIL